MPLLVPLVLPASPSPPPAAATQSVLEPAAPATPTCADDDVPPTKEFSCAQQKAWGKCECRGGVGEALWMLARLVGAGSAGQAAPTSSCHPTPTLLLPLTHILPTLRRHVLDGAQGLLPLHLRLLRRQHDRRAVHRRRPGLRPGRCRRQRWWVEGCELGGLGALRQC